MCLEKFVVSCIHFLDTIFIGEPDNYEYDKDHEYEYEHHYENVSTTEPTVPEHRVDITPPLSEELSDTFSDSDEDFLVW